jgi:hypothetical protein
MSARWLPVVGFEDLYTVSDDGRVFSLRKSRELSPYVSCSGDGYRSVHLYRDSRRTVKAVHQLVLEAFVDACDGRQGNHKNFDKCDNRVENLEWVTPRENIAHMHGAGRRKPSRLCGSENPSSKLVPSDVAAIRAARGIVRQVDLAGQYRVSQQLVSAIQRGEAWR